MTNKTRKQLIDDYLKELPGPALGKEDSFWANVTPVGREFGSKDYERLLEHDYLVRTATNSPDPASLALRVFLDDERATPEGWVRVYWPNEAIDLLETNAVAEISLDHDLGNDQRGTGHDVVLWIEEAV
ncbi:MAG: cyclic-phosphate processing receiver domain-containing protein, partial [Undibacterium umbellatum]|uniref:cyclic-phosphate processing receiver domain-containing protein n=1 Tax=Undibacterium umbellatum TaxID=2762300 RepID=UPI003BB7D8A9